MADVPDDSNPFAIGRNVVGSSTPSGGAQGSTPEAVDTQNPFDIGRNVKRLATNEFLQDSVSKQRDWGEVESYLKDRGYNPAALKTPYQLQQARVKAAQPQEKGLVEKAVDFLGGDTTAGVETTLQKFKRSYLPFGDFLGTNGNTAYSAATAKLKAGDASKEDLDTIARYEQLQKLDEKVAKTFEGKLAGSVGDISKIVGEAGIGGGIVGKAGALSGIGQAEKVTRLGRFGQFAGTQAATLPLVPSMYVPMAQQNNIAQGRAANDWRGYPTAVGYGYANLLVLGQLQGGVSGGNIVSQALKKGALGGAELAGVDVAAGLADEFLPKAFETNTRYGTIGQLARGSGLNLGGPANPNDLRQGFEHAAVTVLTFSALAAMHGRPTRPITEAFAQEANKLNAAGVSEKAAGSDMMRRLQPVEGVLSDPTVTREDAIERVGESYQNDPLVKQLVDALPPKQPAERAAPVETFQQPEAPKPAEPVPPPEPAAPRSPVDVIGEQGLRDLAKQFGLSGKGKIETVLDRINSSPTGKTVLEARMKASEKPTEQNVQSSSTPRGQNETPPQIAPEAPKSPEVIPIAKPLPPPDFVPSTATETAPRGERTHIANYKDPSRSVDKAVEMMDKRGSAPFPLETWQDAENAKGQQAKGTAAFVLDTNHYSGEIHGRKGIDSLRNSKFPLPFDPALKKVVFKGDAAGPEYEKLRDAVYAMNRRRNDTALMQSVGHPGKLAPVRIEVTGQGPVPGNKLIQFDRRTGNTDGDQRRRASDRPVEPADLGAEKIPQTTSEQDKWFTDLETRMEEGGFDEKDTAKLLDRFDEAQKKGGFKAGYDLVEKSLGAIERNVKDSEDLYRATTYQKISTKRRAVLDPIIDRLVAEQGRPRESYEETARAAYVEGGFEAVDTLTQIWRERVNGYDPSPIDHARDIRARDTLKRDLDSDYPNQADARETGESADALAAALLKRVTAKRAVQQAIEVAASQPTSRPRPRQSRQERVPTPEPRAPEEPGPQAPAGQTGEAGVKPPVETFQSPQEKIDALYQAGSPDLKQALEGAMFNHTPEAEGGKPYDLADSVAAEWRGALEMGKPDLAAELAPAVRAAGGSFYGIEPGKKVDYSGKYYESVKGIGAGDRVVVVRQPVVHGPSEKVLVKGVVQPIDRLKGAKIANAIAGPAERRARPGEEKWIAEERDLREQGVVTLADEIQRQYGGLSREKFKSAVGEGEYEKAVGMFGKAAFSDKDGAPGKAHIEDVLAQLEENGTIPRGTTAEGLIELIGSHRPVEGLGGAERDLQRHQLDEARAYEETRIRKENPNLSDAEVEKRVQQALKDQLEGQGGYKPSDESIPFHTPKGETFQSGEPGKPAKALTPYELSATIDHLLDVTNYTEKVTPYGNPAAVSILKAGEAQPQAIVTQKMFAAEPSVRLEEAGHVLAARYGLELAPAALPGNVAQGFLEFWGKPGRAPSRLSTLEGFSQWLIDRTAGRLDPQTPAQKEAATYAEAFVKKNGLDNPLAQLEPLYRAWESLPPIEKAAKLLSGNGLQASAQLSPQQKAKLASDSIRERFQDDIETNLGPLYRIESVISKGLKRVLQGWEKASTVFSQMMGQEKPLAGSYLRDGVKTIQDGKWVTIGQSEAKILEGSKPEWLTPIFDGGPSKFDLWTVARHLEGEFGRGAKPVPDAMRADYKAAYDELAKDAEFAAWADPAAERLTRAFKDSIAALEGNGIHALPVGTSDLLHKKRPDYVPTERVLTDKGWSASSGSRGERGRSILKERSGSGEQIVSPLVSYRKRLLLVASVTARQIKFNAMTKLSRQPGMGDYLLAGESQLSAPGKEALDRISARLEELGITGADVTQMMKDIGIQNGEAMFVNKPWDNDPTKNTYWGVGEDGRPTNFRVADRALYDLVTDQQVESHQMAKIVNGIANFSVGGVRPIKAMGDLVKLGATSVNLAFHLRNIPRDAFAFWTNTIDRATIGQLPDALKRAFAFEFGVLKAGLRGETFQSADRLFQLFHDARGDQLRQFAFESKNPLGASETFQQAPASKVTKAIHGTAGFLKDALNAMGAGELGPRFLEFKTRLKQLTGLDEAGLVSKLDAAEKAAAEGKDYVQPFDYTDILDAMDKAAEVTVPFGRQGVLTRELNKIQPYFGPAIAGASKAIRNIKDNPKGALMGLATIAGLRLLHWATFKDEQWYEELSATDRYRNFVVPTPWGLRRVPAPRGLEVPVGGFLLPMLDKAAGKKPDVRGLVTSTIDDLAPPLPITPIGHVAVDVATNKNWRGTPIVPGRDEHLSATDKALQYQLPYAAEQLSGGRANLSFRGAGVVPFTEVKNARRSVDEFYETFQELETARLQAKNRGEKFTEEARLLRFEHAKKQIEDISRQIRGGSVVNGRVVSGSAPSEDRQKELRERQLQIARNLLSLSRAP